MLAGVPAVLDRVPLELTVDGRVHLRDQCAVEVLRDQLVPRGAPDDLHDVPPGAAEDPFEFLADLADVVDGAAA